MWEGRDGEIGGGGVVNNLFLFPLKKALPTVEAVRGL